MMRAFAALASLCVVNVLFLVAASQDQGLSAARSQLYGVLAHFSLGSVLVVWVLSDKVFERVPLAAVVVLAVLLRVIAAWAHPLLEDDHYRYLWDGFRTATSFNPYARSPSEFFSDTTLGGKWDQVLHGINNPELTSIYGPVLQYVFAIAYFLAPGKVGAIQYLLVLIDLVLIAVLAAQRLPVRWLLVYAVHPLVLKEAIASAHPDILIGLFVVLACGAWKRGAAHWVGVWVGLAVATKIPAVVSLAFLFWRCKSPELATRDTIKTQSDLSWRFRAGFSALITLGALYVPFWWASGTDIVALTTFGERWKFNPLLFRVLELVFAPHLARILALAAFLIVCFWLARDWKRRPAATPAIDLGFAAMLLLSPVVNPWYWLWGLAVAILLGRSFGILLACSASLSYLNGTVMSEANVATWLIAADASFQVPWSITIAQLVLAGLFFYWRSQLDFVSRSGVRH
jgi:alpha-1,6-mannosyltransferase